MERDENQERCIKVLEKILDESRRKHNYRIALERCHQIILYPSPKEENPEERLVLRKGETGVDLILERKPFYPSKYQKICFPQEAIKLLEQTPHYNHERITPEGIAKNFTEALYAPLADILAEKDLNLFETYLLKN